MVIRTRQLGLAAFIKMNNVHLIGVESKEFVFDSVDTIDVWKTKYVNSCCSKHDSLVCELRFFIK